MIKLAIDSDGLIKLAKSNILKNVLKSFNCNITNEIYNETVTEGKNKLYEDAFFIGDLVDKNLLQVKDTKYRIPSNILKETKNLGKGEVSVLSLYFEIGTKAIISDDLAFLKLLKKFEIPFIIPIDLIIMMVNMKTLKREKAQSAIEKIRGFVREECYAKAKTLLGVK